MKFLLFLAFSTLYVFAGQNMKLYGGLGYSIEFVEDVDKLSPHSIELTFGGVAKNNFGYEVQYANVFRAGKIEDEYGIWETSGSRLSFHATYTFKLENNIYLRPKFGFTHYNMEVEYTETRETEDDSSMNVSYGADIVYKANKSISYYGGFTWYNPEYNNVSLDASKFSFGIQIKL